MAFIRLLPKIEVVPVKKRLYSNKRKKTVQKTPSLFETIPFKVLCKIGFNYISEDLIFPKTKNLLNWKATLHCWFNVELTARWLNQKTKNVRNISLTGEK